MTKSLSQADDRRKHDVSENYKIMTERIALAEQQAGRNPGEVELVAVTKTVPAALISHSIGMGVRHIGENRVQELNAKLPYLPADRIKISMIGHLQTNKVRAALSAASMIQSVDSERLAREISRIAAESGKTVECLVEVNIGNEAAKSGVEHELCEELIHKMSEMPGIKVLGLMAIPPVEADIYKTRQYFFKLHKIFIDICDKNRHNSNINMRYLSMGMSSDYFEAILEGANMIRVGSALYGARGDL